MEFEAKKAERKIRNHIWFSFQWQKYFLLSIVILNYVIKIYEHIYVYMDIFQQPNLVLCQLTVFSSLIWNELSGKILFLFIYFKMILNPLRKKPLNSFSKCNCKD